jgi:hypothetical protein
MAISFNIADILKLFKDRRATDRSLVAEYLSAIATGGEKLAEIWLAMMKYQLLTNEDVIEVSVVKEGLSLQQTIHGGAIAWHYQRASRVLEGR